MADETPSSIVAALLLDQEMNEKRGRISRVYRVRRIPSYVLFKLGTGKLRALIRRVLGWPDVVVVTSYEGMKSLKALLLPCNWDYCVLDEGQRIRNPDAEVGHLLL